MITAIITAAALSIALTSIVAIYDALMKGNKQ